MNKLSSTAAPIVIRGGLGVGLYLIVGVSRPMKFRNPPICVVASFSPISTINGSFETFKMHEEI